MEYSIELPRLTLNYYFWIAAFALLISGIALVAFKRSPFVRFAAEHLMIYCAAFILSLMLVMGKVYGFATYDLMTDLTYTLIVSLPLTFAGHVLSFFVKKKV